MEKIRNSILVAVKIKFNCFIYAFDRTDGNLIEKKMWGITS